MNQGLPSISEMRDEIDEYCSVLMGNQESPTGNGVMSLLEYANAVYSRGMELSILLHRAEADGHVAKGSQYYRFRTGELRAFNELASKAIDLGSRRVTHAKLEYDMERG